MKIMTLYLLIFLLSLSFLSFQGEATVTPDPDPARFQSEIDLFVEWDQKNSHPAQAILFIGSSSIRMWLTRQAFPDFPIINRGFGGAQTSDWAHFYEQVGPQNDARGMGRCAGDVCCAAGNPAE